VAQPFITKMLYAVTSIVCLMYIWEKIKYVLTNLQISFYMYIPLLLYSLEFKFMI